jgi:hypothetical protein
VGDGVTDDTAAIQAALDEVGAAGGGTVELDTKSYRIDGTLSVPAHTTLQGTYWGPSRRNGTVLLSTVGRGRSDGPGCVLLRSGIAALRNVRIEYPDQDPEASEPVPYPFAVQGGHSSRVEEVFLYNAYQGIDFDTAHAGFIRNVWGEPLRVGIRVDHCYDICRIENVHFWPYFTNGKPLRDWVQQNGVAFEFGRSDWQYCLNVFSYGYHTGFRFYHTDAMPELNYAEGTTNGNFVGIGADRVCVAVDVEDSFNIGVSITNGEFAPFGAVDGRAILLHEGNTGNLTFTNCSFWAVTSSLAEVNGGSLVLQGCNIHAWALLEPEMPCLLVSGGRLSVSGSTFNQGGLLGRFSGDNTRVSLVGNTATEELRVENAIAERAVVGLNNPPVVVEPQP